MAFKLIPPTGPSSHSIGSATLLWGWAIAASPRVKSTATSAAAGEVGDRLGGRDVWLDANSPNGPRNSAFAQSGQYVGIYRKRYRAQRSTQRQRRASERTFDRDRLAEKCGAFLKDSLVAKRMA